jgi:kynurenine formamidase
MSESGPQDERGAANRLTRERVRAAAGLVREGRLYELGQRIGHRTPTPPHRNPPAHFMDRVGGDYVVDGRRISGFQYSDDSLLVALHTGTHVDSLAHVWDGDRLYNGFSPETITSKSGATRCGIDKLGPIIGRGVLLDVGPLDAHAPVNGGMLERCAEKEGVEVGEGDVVLVRTGWWAEAHDDPERYFSSEPGVDLDGARWLAERRVAATGSDNYAYEMLPVEGEPFPVHRFLLWDCGIPLIEGLLLDELAADGVFEFLFAAIPLPVVGGTGSPVAPIAIV